MMNSDAKLAFIMAEYQTELSLLKKIMQKKWLLYEDIGCYILECGNNSLNKFKDYKKALEYAKEKLNKIEFEILVLHNRGLGDEYIKLETIEANNMGEAKNLGESIATDYFNANFKNHQWMEVSVRPASQIKA